MKTTKALFFSKIGSYSFSIFILSFIFWFIAWLFDFSIRGKAFEIAVVTFIAMIVCALISAILDIGGTGKRQTKGLKMEDKDMALVAMVVARQCFQFLNSDEKVAVKILANQILTENPLEPLSDERKQELKKTLDLVHNLLMAGQD